MIVSLRETAFKAVVLVNNVLNIFVYFALFHANWANYLSINRYK